MNFKEFKESYDRLSDVHKKVVEGTLLRMKHKQEHKDIPAKGYDIADNINEERKKQGLTREKLIEKINELNNGAEMRSTYNSMMNRRSENSTAFKSALEVLGMTEADAKRPPKDYIQIMFSDAASMKWQFETLEDADRRAIEYLVCALYMVEVAPEVFTYNEEDNPDAYL